mmetsp:Transcript_7952/g.20896  ORF Transcript_7952/g.20896 Transcript_7952/m.20896 type:complete len:262 (+) Transcript_7952:219-1004(+)
MTACGPNVHPRFSPHSSGGLLSHDACMRDSCTPPPTIRRRDAACSSSRTHRSARRTPPTAPTTTTASLHLATLTCSYAPSAYTVQSSQSEMRSEVAGLLGGGTTTTVPRTPLTSEGADAGDAAATRLAIADATAFGLASSAASTLARHLLSFPPATGRRTSASLSTSCGCTRVFSTPPLTMTRNVCMCFATNAHIAASSASSTSARVLAGDSLALLLLLSLVGDGDGEFAFLVGDGVGDDVVVAFELTHTSSCHALFSGGL